MPALSHRPPPDTPAAEYAPPDPVAEPLDAPVVDRESQPEEAAKGDKPDTWNGPQASDLRRPNPYLWASASGLCRPPDRA